MTGFAESFSHYLMEVGSGGGSQQPEDDPEAQSVLFVVGEKASLTYGGKENRAGTGSYAYLPAGLEWQLQNNADSPCHFHWIRKRYHRVAGIEVPQAFVTSDRDVAPIAMPDTDGIWSTTRFVSPEDLAHDMHVNIVTFLPGGCIPFAGNACDGTWVICLTGQGRLLSKRAVDRGSARRLYVLRAFCPQACYAAGMNLSDICCIRM